MPRLLTPSRIAEFRNRLCDVAMQLLAEVGYEGFNMRELAARLGVSAMTAYRYFKDKDEILAAVRARAFERFAERLEAANVPSSSGDWTELCRAYVEFALQEEIYYRLMFDAPRTATVPAEVESAENRMRKALVDHARTVLGDGQSSGNPEIAGWVFWSLLHGIAGLRLSGKLPDADVPTVLVEGLRAVFVGYARDPNGYDGHIERRLEASGLRSGTQRRADVRVLPAAG